MWTESGQCVRRKLLLGSESVAGRDSPGSVLSVRAQTGGRAACGREAQQVSQVHDLVQVIPRFALVVMDV